MPSSKQRISTCAPVGSPTVKAPCLISKNKAKFLAATKKPTLMGTPILCASVNAIVRSATYAQQKAVSRSSSSRRKEHRRSTKSPPPAPMNFYLCMPPSSTAAATSPAEPPGPGTSTEADETQRTAAPKALRSANDLRNRLDARRSVLAGTTPSLDKISPRIASDPPTATSAPPSAPRVSVLQRISLRPPSTPAPGAPAPTFVPRAPRLSTAPPPPRPPAPAPAAALGQPPMRPSNSNKRKKRRALQFAQLLLETLPANPSMLRRGTPSGATPAALLPPPPAFAPVSPDFPPPAPTTDQPAPTPSGATPAVLLPPPPAFAPASPDFPPPAPTTDQPAPAYVSPSLEDLCARTVPLPTLQPAVASPPVRAHLGDTLGLNDDDDFFPPPDSSSPTVEDGNPTSDMDISPQAELPPPRLRPDTPPAAATPIARRALNPYLTRPPPSGEALGLGPNYPVHRAMALVSGDKSIPFELLPRLNEVLRETRLPTGVLLRDLVRFATGNYGDTAPLSRPAVTQPTGTRVKAMARRLRPAAPQVADPAPAAAMPRALTQLTLPPSPPPRGSSRSASPSDFDPDDLSVVLDTESEADLSATEAADSPCPSPPAAAPLHTTPSPPPARPTPQRFISVDGAPVARASTAIRWPPLARTSLFSDVALALQPPTPAQ